MLHIPTEFPEKITTLIFDSLLFHVLSLFIDCTIEDIEYEENAAPPLHTLVFQSNFIEISLYSLEILSLSHFVFPQHACYSLTQLKLTRFLLR